MTRPVHRFPGNPAGRLLLVLVLVLACPQVWTWTLLGQDGSSDTYRTAYGRGYGDGRRSGESDRAARHYYDMANKRDYQRLDPGFDPERDDPEAYRNAYRRGFEAGYDEGYYPDRPRSRRRDPAPGPDGPKTRSPAAADSESKLRVPAGTEIRIRMKEALTTRTHKVGDAFAARVIHGIDAGRVRAIPKGVEVRGSISQLVRAGRIRGRARMNLHFKELRFRDGRVVPMDAQMASLVEPRKKSVPDEEGTLEEPGEKGRDAGKVGASSAIGALIGLIGGGKEGVAVGAAAGAAVGAAGILVTRGRDIVIPFGTEIVIRLSKDLDIPASRRSPPRLREDDFPAGGDAL